MRALCTLALSGLLLVALLLAAPGAAAGLYVPPSCDVNAQQLLERTLDRRLDSNIIMPQLSASPIGRSGHGTASYNSIRVAIAKPAGMSQDVWQRIRFIGASRSRDQIIQKGPGQADFARAPVWVGLESRTTVSAQLNVETNSVRRGIFFEDWILVVALCDDQSNSMIGFASVPVRVHAWGPPATLSVLVVLGTWFLVAIAAWKQHAPRLQAAWRATQRGLAAEEAKPVGFGAGLTPDHQHRLRWKLRQSINPIFISQDGLGTGSLGRLQLFLFSFAVAGIVFYIWLRTGVLVGFSNDVLALLGISAASSVLSRVAEASPTLKSPNRSLLLRLGIVRAERSMPSMRDVISGNGEIDVTRVQALLFTGITLAALVANGTTDLANFRLPEQILWLMGVSQGVYVGGKLIPGEACKRLDAEFDVVREAAQAARGDGDPMAATRFAQARNGALHTLREIYGERLDEGPFAALRPEDV